AKVPLKVGAVPVQALVVPFVPAFGVPHKKMPAAFACVGEKADTVESPGVLPVTVIVLVLDAAVTRADAGHKLIAAARVVAKVVVLEAVTNVPVKVGAEPPHPAVPLVPAVTVPLHA